MKNTALLLFLLYTIKMAAQDAGTIEAFRQLRTTEQRFAFLDPVKELKMDKPTFDALLPIIKKKKDHKTLFYWHYLYFRFGGGVDVSYKEMGPKSLEQMAEIAKGRGFEAELIVTQLYTEFNGSDLRTQEHYYPLALNLFERVKRLGFDKFKDYDINNLLQIMGYHFYNIGDYEHALEVLLEAEKRSPADPNPHVHTLLLNLIQSTYANTKNYPQAITYAKKIYDLNLKGKYAAEISWYATFWRGLSSLDIAQYLFEMGKIEAGEKYADRGYQLYKAQEDLNAKDKLVATFDALQVVINIKLRLGKVGEVEPLFKKVELIKPKIDFSTEGHYFKSLKLYRNYTQYYEIKKDYTHAYRYLKLANDLQDSLGRQNDKRKLWQIESRVKADNYQSQINKAEKESRLQERLRNFAIGTLILFAGIAFGVYRRIKRDNAIITGQKALLEQSLSEKETLLKEIHHRVKNNLQIISGLFDKQARQSMDETTRKLIKEGQDRVFSIALVHKNLYESESLSTIEIKSYLEVLTGNIEKSQKKAHQDIKILLSADDTLIDIDTVIPLGLILNELITNCYKYAFKGRKVGEIQVSCHQQNGLLLEVRDNGVGLPADFSLKKSRALGMNLVLGLTRQLNGILDFTTSDQGTAFTIVVGQK